jgi:drug/metabolite transporter (DMT)-like permease
VSDARTLVRDQTAAAGTGTDLVYLRSAALVVLAGALWSTGGVLVKLVETADSVQIVLYRSLFVIPVVAGFMTLRGRGAVLAGLRKVGWNGVLGGFLLAGAFIAFVTALTVTTVANAAFVLGAMPLMAALLGRLVLGEPVRAVTWAAMAAAAVGVAVIAAPGLGPGRAAGTLLALAGCACFALFSVLLRRARSEDGTPWLLLGALFAALICALLLVLGRGPGSLAIGGRDLLACATMGIVQIGCGLIAFTAGSRRLPAADLVLLTQAEVVLAPVWAWLVVGEVPAFWTLAGGAIVLGAVTLQAVAGTRRGGAGQNPRNR